GREADDEAEQALVLGEGSRAPRRDAGDQHLRKHTTTSLHEHLAALFEHYAPRISERSPPPCGEGLGVGVAGGRRASPNCDPPPQPSPARGEGALALCQAYCGSRPASLTTCCATTRSFLIFAANSSGELIAGTSPRL